MTSDNGRPESEIDNPAAQAVSAALDELGVVDPPRDLVATVMSRVSNLKQTADGRRLVQPSGGKQMSRKVLIGFALAAGIVIAVGMFTGYPPLGKGIEGTIGAAKRYHAEQIKNEDVKTTDADLQAFLQSDTFHRLTTDKASRQVLSNGDFRRAASEPSVRAALAVSAVREALADKAVAGALADSAVAQALADKAVVNALASAAFQNAVAAQGVQAALRAVAASLNVSGVVQQALASSALANAMASTAFRSALASAAFQSALASAAFQNMLSSAAFQSAMSSAAFQSAMSSAAFQSALASQSFFSQATAAMDR